MDKAKKKKENLGGGALCPQEETLFGAMANSVEYEDDIVSPIYAATPKHKVEDLLAEMPEGLSMIEGWDVMAPVGKESY